jgi:hypothetical protein
MLKTVPAISNGDGIAKILYPNFIDRNFAKIRLTLDVLHISGIAPVMDLTEESGSFTPNDFLWNRWHLSDYQWSARGIARASRNKSVPSPVHAPYPHKDLKYEGYPESTGLPKYSDR